MSGPLPLPSGWFPRHYGVDPASATSPAAASAKRSSSSKARISPGQSSKQQRTHSGALPTLADAAEMLSHEDDHGTTVLSSHESPAGISVAAAMGRNIALPASASPLTHSMERSMDGRAKHSFLTLPNSLNVVLHVTQPAGHGRAGGSAAAWQGSSVGGMAHSPAPANSSKQATNGPGHSGASHKADKCLHLKAIPLAGTSSSRGTAELEPETMTHVLQDVPVKDDAGLWTLIGKPLQAALQVSHMLLGVCYI